MALLPALDPTVMGWQERSWYGGDHLAAVFDRLEVLAGDLTGLADARVEDGLRRYVTECRREPVLRNALATEDQEAVA
mgnify:CR=1 FL=1